MLLKLFSKNTFTIYCFSVYYSSKDSSYIKPYPQTILHTPIYVKIKQSSPTSKNLRCCSISIQKPHSAPMSSKCTEKTFSTSFLPLIIRK